MITVDKLSTLVEQGDKAKVSWLAEWKEQLNTMNKEKEKYPPQIRTLIEQAASEVIYHKKTTLTNAKFKNSDADFLSIAESKYLDFYRKLQALLYPSRNQETEVPSKPKSSEYKNLFGTEITSKTWRGYHGFAQEITEQNWKNYVSMLIDLNNQGRIDYGSAYPNNKEHYSSLVYYEDMLYIDCWGLIKTGAKVTLESAPLNELILNGPVNTIYKALERKGEVQKTVINNEITYPDLKTGISIFIDNTKERIDSSGKSKFVGYDHVMTYIKDLDYMDANGQPIHLDHALVGIGAKGEGLQIYNLNTKYDEWTSKGIEFRWGDQLRITGN